MKPMKKILSIFILMFSLWAGAKGTQNDQPVVAYPNPAKDFLYIKTANPNIKIKSVTFYSILGNMVAEMPINANFSEIRVDRLKSGKYLMKYTLNDNSQKIIQIIKQ